MVNIALSKLSKSITSGLTPLRTNDEFWANGIIPWLKTEQLGEKYIYDTNEYISQEALNGTTIKINPKNTLSIAMYGEGKTRGSVSILKNEMTTNQACCNIYLDDKKADYEYVYYYIKNQYDNLRNLSSGVRKNLNSNDIKNFKINIPKDVIKQQKIANVLSSLDEKIELNNKINKELEAMAKALYDYWFVQFDFPDKNGNPYKSSGGKMVYNKELKREIPESWKNKILDDIISKTGTGLNPRDNFKLGCGNNYYVTIKNIAQGRVILDDKCDKVDDEALKIINKRSDLQVGDILFTSIQPVGVTYLIQKRPENWNINESVFTIRPNYKLVTSNFLFMLVSSDFMKIYTNNVSTGSIHKGIRHTDLKAFKFAYPSEKVINLFDKKIQPILKKMYINEQQNQKLSKLRDWLLPMLMNGQVMVK